MGGFPDLKQVAFEERNPTFRDFVGLSFSVTQQSNFPQSQAY
ncbi:hypothetical protein GXM_05445 [Nostoc sphaeroides CCNUC1]|uniref:Uncharacterized protein n=1 Tax=Nostoc sphaeroides CCNUC1 TaxID=2653204 RepID=A0A5P8W5D8_9NOSO|nr:hypothetical protein GXM_05445 [Nostoc sphaeroides CCNUC1]